MKSSQQPGLDGVVAAETRLSRVDGERGELVLAGHRMEELAPHARFEEVAGLLLYEGSRGALGSPLREPAAADHGAGVAFGRRRPLPRPVVEVLRAAAARKTAPMDALLAGVAACAVAGGPRDSRGDGPGDSDGGWTDGEIYGDAIEIVSAVCSAFARLRSGLEPVPLRRDLGHVAHHLWLLTGAEPVPAYVRALETYFNTVSDHGLNASTFAARVTASTGSDLMSAICAALATLKGPLHGGAPGPALAALLELRERPGDLDGNTRSWVGAEVGAGRRIMGFGHRVYKVRDPRADVLGAAAQRLARDASAADDLFRDARIYERAVVETLAELKPGRGLQTNVEFYTALLLHGVGLDAEQFTPTFACARVAGWAAHFVEQVGTGRLLRPRGRYIGAVPRGLGPRGEA